MENMGTNKPLILEHTFLASENTLFDAWLTPPVTELWQFQSRENPINFFADIREGGAFHTEEKKNSSAVSHRGEYVEIERPHKLVFTLEVPSHFKGKSEIIITIKEGPGGANLSFIQKNVDPSKNVGPWQAMFEALQDLLIQPYLVTNTADVKQLVEAINVTVMQIAGFLMPLRDAEINKVPFKESWTPAQLVRHITKSMSGLGELLSKPVKPAERDPYQKVLPLKQAFLDITHRMQSPDFIVPEEKVYDKPKILEDLNTCLFLLNHSEDKIDGTGLITDLPLGDVTKLELLHFLLYHAQRHLIQMKRITDALHY
jgi:uncharacterized protein YndB with AHSA1/START domain